MGDLAAQLRVERQKTARTREELAQAEEALDRQRRADHRQAVLNRITEPLTYSRESPHSYFADLARARLGFGDGDGGKSESLERLNAHVREMAVELPTRRAARTRAARDRLERVLTADAAERRALDRFEAAGGRLFETRAVTRVDGAGGYFSPPIWLLDEFSEAIRAGRQFADQWTNIPLPPATDSINVPRINVGAATGPQVADGGPVPGRDLQDSLVTGLVRTIAGVSDASLQLLEQSPQPGVDAVVFAELMADYNLNLNGQCLIGSGVNGQIAGAILAGAPAAANSVVVANANNSSSQTWVSGGASGDSVNVSAAKLLSVIARLRKRWPTAWALHSWVWAFICASVDSQNRPLVPPGAGPPDPEGTGIAGHLHSVPVIIAPDMPVGFGGTTVPVIGGVSTNGSAAVDGNGNYSVLLAGYWPDALLFESEPRIDVLREVLSGSLQVRFRAFNYVAAIPNRFQAAAASGSFVSAGGCVSFGTLTQFQTNSVLQISTSGY